MRSCARSPSPKTPRPGSSRSRRPPTSDSPRGSPAGTSRRMLRRLEDIPAHWARLRAHETALVEGERSWTWSELEHGRRALAARLAGAGVRAGDRVMLVGENCASMVALFFALASLDAWIVNVNARM